MRLFIVIFLIFFGLFGTGFSQDDHANNGTHVEGACEVYHQHFNEPPYDPSGTAVHHISDQNHFNVSLFVKEFYIPLPCILKSEDDGLAVFSSGKFHATPEHHGDGHNAYKGYVMKGGAVRRVKDASFPKENVEIEGFTKDGRVVYNGQCFEIEGPSKWDGGMIGGGMTSFYDFSITKNVFAMMIVALLVGWVFISCARAYQKRDGQAPTGLQNFMEPFFIFIKEEVAEPVIGPRYEKYMPFIMALFFFILGLNLFGQIPFVGNPNVTGNIAVTGILAVLTFIITTVSGNKHYWQHVLWMPGVPWPIKLILTPIEIMGLVLKPFTLMIRLFANISAGHIAILSFVGLIFIFGNNGASMGGGIGGLIASTLLTLFMSCIELLVAFIQAFIFAILSASYIGAAIEEHDHGHDVDHAH